MKNLSIFLFVVGLCMISDVYGKKSTITVKNELNPKNKNILKVHCKSKNNDIGVKYLKIGEVMSFSFKTNFWGTTEFWCNLYKGPDYKRYRGITAYQAIGLFAKDGSSYNWLARDDGIYFHKDSLPSYYKTYWL
ncbi:S-protein 21 [Arabidopsis thaliana]|uniref:S-protein homolog 21 n=3 Tax=Arabidopsis TaxID=3701 RepID=SPH21_ARATH|nr:Plant self-incompatibility protein S1 family [Arabidopsis thaliana]Q9LW22.1 RecName: Full=S-protein homolog 21; Flags: Precursor [Arabidopsis thaliana]KAG7626721.1 Plant self-incompatibility S1 [Arabidopsis thaliana x Arabidopsis arenosa]AEE77228.1 Plant self-incompatibility protein S1 family [Arabidopsis thaliana]OAP02391.1 hypothetical protein AXX17_AT3G29250 [Arabidopsis thaliana]CAA0383813.1 unnamed protein product [Arabidopsis thaliana]BAB01235.1 unnamed protein product [Arabidopsis t|eukprot:NP_189323.1 Plant self-incompatibility protein S1 family [Arabidopsis thaliana]